MRTICVDRGTIYIFRIVFNVNTTSGDEGKRSEDRERHNNTVTNMERLKVMANFDVVHNDVHVY